ncbi:MAG: Zn-dependent protease, partial [Candidatus Neomarinimicrobiota bacterium]
LIEYDLAAEYYPENPELPFWTAVSLASVDRVDEALPIFKEVFEKAPDLRNLIPRLIPAGLLPDDKMLIERIQKQ